MNLLKTLLLSFTFIFVVLFVVVFGLAGVTLSWAIVNIVWFIALVKDKAQQTAQ